MERCFRKLVLAHPVRWRGMTLNGPQRGYVIVTACLPAHN